LTEIKSQIEVACLGIAQTVKDLQSATGVKDAYTQCWINILIERAQAVQKENPITLTTTIQAELMGWVSEHEEAIYNAFLTMDGMELSRLARLLTQLT
jgi:hypothetical protein